MARSPFLDPAKADAEGLVAVGLDLSPERLLEAYRLGIFPFFDESTPTLWWSPDPRAIFERGGLHVSRRLARTVRSGKFSVTLDTAFPDVIAGCAHRPGQGIWLTAEMIAAYTRLHELGHAHSLEVWSEGVLAGGVYGLALGGLFAGESMFSRITDASKVALVHLHEHLWSRGFQLFDVQFLNDHTASLGAIEIPRSHYLRRLRQALACRVSFV